MRELQRTKAWTEIGIKVTMTKRKQRRMRKKNQNENKNQKNIKNGNKKENTYKENVGTRIITTVRRIVNNENDKGSYRVNKEKFERT